MSLHYRQRAAALVQAALVAACSPALNWREVPMEGLVALLPCKPDHAQRRVQLGAQDTMLQVSGCETAGALYAISHLHVTDAAQVDATQAAWRQSTLATLQAASALQTQPMQLAKPLPGKAQAPATSLAGAAMFTLEKLEGKRADGTAVQAQLAWLAKGQDIYQVAVYGTTLDKDSTELLFSELRLQ